MRRIVLLALLVLFSALISAAPSHVSFVAQVANTESVEDDVVVLTMILAPGFTLPVRITGETEITDGDDAPLEPADIVVGMVLKIKGLFTSDGILAQEVRVLRDENDFGIRGTIDDIQLEERTIAVEDVTIQVPTDTLIEDEKGNPLLLEDLQVGEIVRVRGNIVEGQFVAVKIKVQKHEVPLVRLSYEGIVTSVNSDETEILVLIEGVGPAVVHIVPETEVKGDLAVGVLVRVIGTLESDLSTKAHKIIVQRLLQLAPSTLKMHINQTRRVQIILRGRLETDVNLVLESADTGIATVVPNVVTIPADKVTGSFEVTSGAEEGETVIHVSMPADLGGLTAELHVEVEARGNDDEDDDEDKELEVRFRPGEVRMGTNRSRRVHLFLNQPAPDPLTVQLLQTEGPEGLVSFAPEEVHFEAGSRKAVIEIQSGEIPGEVEITATLPSEFGGDEDDLKVKVRMAGDDDDEEEEEEEED